MSDAADRLARSRLAILQQVQRRERRHGRDDGREAPRGDKEHEWEHASNHQGTGGWFAGLRHALGSWWRHHPAHMALELATPALSSYAQRKPVQFLGIAAAVGAVVVIARPWRLISATGLVMALLKSSQLSALVMSAMSAANFEKDNRPYP